VSAPISVFITGASSGIGRALALEYAKSGASIAIVARRKDALDALAKEIEDLGGRALTFPLDVRDDAALKAALVEADTAFEGIDRVIANAGTSHMGSTARQPWEKLREVIDINVIGAMATLSLAIPIMIARRRGHLVGISSLAGRRPIPGYGSYSASKAALSSYLETLRLDLGRHGLDVTDVQPGFVETPLLDKGGSGRKKQLPFLWPADKAARVIVERLESRPAVIAFPWPLAFLTAFARLLPRWIYEPMIRSVTR